MKKFPLPMCASLVPLSNMKGQYFAACVHRYDYKCSVYVTERGLKKGKAEHKFSTSIHLIKNHKAWNLEVNNYMKDMNKEKK